MPHRIERRLPEDGEESCDEYQDVVQPVHCEQRKLRGAWSVECGVFEVRSSWPSGMRAGRPGSAIGRKAAEGSRTPRRFANSLSRAYLRQLLECGCLLPLSSKLRRVPGMSNRARADVP